MLSRIDEARDMLQAVLARGVELAAPRLQLGALGQLAELAAELGRWDEMADWAQRMRVVAQACGDQPRLGSALCLLGGHDHKLLSQRSWPSRAWPTRTWRSKERSALTRDCPAPSLSDRCSRKRMG